MIYIPRIYKWIIIALIIFLFLVPLFMLLTNTVFQVKFTEWSNIATFCTYFVTIINLILIGYISYLAYKTSDSYNNLIIKPILYLVNKESTKFNIKGQNAWYVVNGAKHSAMNLLVRYNLTEEGKFTKWVACNSLGENQETELFFILNANKIEICYTDITSKKYYRLDFKDFSGVINDINEDCYKMYLKEAVSDKCNIAKINDEFKDFYDGINVEKYMQLYIKRNLFDLL